MSKKYKEKLERLRAQDALRVGEPSHRVPPAESVDTPSRYGRRELTRNEPTVRASVVYRFLQLDIVARSEGHVVAQLPIAIPFRPQSILLFGASPDSVLESLMIGNYPALLSPLSGALFETPLLEGDGSLLERLSKLEGPAQEILESLMLLRQQDMPTANEGQVIRAVLTGQVEHVILWGATFL